MLFCLSLTAINNSQLTAVNPIVKLVPGRTPPEDASPAAPAGDHGAGEANLQLARRECQLRPKWGAVC